MLARDPASLAARPAGRCHPPSKELGRIRHAWPRVENALTAKEGALSPGFRIFGTMPALIKHRHTGAKIRAYVFFGTGSREHRPIGSRR
jgi:hypothetical protein